MHKINLHQSSQPHRTPAFLRPPYYAMLHAVPACTPASPDWSAYDEARLDADLDIAFRNLTAGADRF